MKFRVVIHKGKDIIYNKEHSLVNKTIADNWAIEMARQMEGSSFFTAEVRETKPVVVKKK